MLDVMFRAPAQARFLPSLFAGAIFTSAALVFTVEPMVAKMILPLLGGSPAVWNVCMAFFQTMLLAGYGYAHLLQRVLATRLQLLAHLAMLAMAALFLPIAVTAAFGAPPAAAPVGWLLGILLVSVGLPFAALSATAPLLQAWYAAALQGGPETRNPYILYGASNLGSLLALLAYPILIEPQFALPQQTILWAGIYALFCALIVATGACLWQAAQARIAIAPSRGLMATPLSSPPQLGGSAAPGCCSRPARPASCSARRPISPTTSPWCRSSGSCPWRKPVGQGKSGWAKAGQVIPAEQALDFFTTKIRLDPKNPFPFAMVGLLRADKHEYDLAIRSYDEAIRLDPKSTASFSGRASSRAARREFDKAVADYDVAIRLEPRNTGAYIGRGLAQAAKNGLTQAIADFSEAIWLDPLSTAAYFGPAVHGRARVNMPRRSSTLTWACGWTQSRPQESIASTSKAWEAPGRFSKAVADFNEAIRIDPRNARAYLDRARVLLSFP